MARKRIGERMVPLIADLNPKLLTEPPPGQVRCTIQVIKVIWQVKREQPPLH